MKSFALLFLFAISAFADPALKPGQIGLSPDQASTEFRVGDEVSLLLLTNEKLGDKSTIWKLDIQSNSRWIPFGGVSIDQQSIQALETPMGTKIALRGLLLSTGPVKVEKLRLLDQEKKFAIEANGIITGKAASRLSDEDRKNPTWIFNPMSFGGWDILRIALFAIIIAVVVGALFWFFAKIIAKRKRPRPKNPKEAALQALEELQGFARGGSKRSLAEWKQFSYCLTHALRQFCANLYHFPTHDLTDRELLDALKPLTGQDHFLKELQEILGRLDSARYGQQEGDASLAAALLVDSKRHVEQLFEYEEAKRKAAEGGKR